MRQALIDELRHAQAERHGGGVRPVTSADDDALALALPVQDRRAAELHELLHHALRDLDRLDPDLAEVADMRWFGGFSEVEIAELQGETERAVRRRWLKARAILLSALGDEGASGAVN